MLAAGAFHGDEQLRRHVAPDLERDGGRVGRVGHRGRLVQSPVTTDDRGRVAAGGRGTMPKASSCSGPTNGRAKLWPLQLALILVAS
jgi:hypothetical protein